MLHVSDEIGSCIRPILTLHIWPVRNCVIACNKNKLKETKTISNGIPKKVNQLNNKLNKKTYYSRQ